MELSFTQRLVREELLLLIKRAEADPDREFITDLGIFETKVVDTEKRLTSLEFEDVCRSVLNEIKKRDE